MEEQKPQFKQEYDEFMSYYKTNPVGTEEIGKTIGRQIQLYGDLVRVFVDTKIAFGRRLAELEQSVDENTGKVYSSAKAEKIADSLPEGVALLRSEWDMKLAMEQVGALRNMQQGVRAEMNMSGGI